MADQNDSGQGTDDAAHNPDAANWVDPNTAKGAYADGHPGDVEQDPISMAVQERLEAARAEGKLEPLPENEPAVSESEPKESKEAAKPPAKGSAKETDKAKAAGSEPEKSFSEAWLKVAKKEAEVRTQRKQLQESQKQLEAYDKAKALAATDPLAVLEALGITTEEQLQSLAKQAYYKSVGEELAPADFKQSQQLLSVKRELAALKASQEQSKADSEAQQLAAQQQAYKSSLVEHVTDSVIEASPMMGRVIADENFGAKAVESDLWAVAEMIYAETNEVPAPTAVAQRLEQEYAKKLGGLISLENADETTQEVQPATKPKSKTVRNKNTKTQTALESLDQYKNAHGDADAYQKLADLARANFYAKHGIKV